MYQGIETETTYHVASLGSEQLALFVGPGGFHFSALGENNHEVFKNAGHGDIEGKWVLVYVGVKGGEVHGFVKIENEPTQTVSFTTTAAELEVLNFRVGGILGEAKSF